MTISLYINGNKIEFYFDMGWYKGEDTYLMGLELFHKMDDIKMINIFKLNIIKFSIAFGFTWK